jgi:transposase-like protein
MNEATPVEQSPPPASRIGARRRWQTIIEEQRHSGMGVSAFCRLRSIPASSFFGWRRKLQEAQSRREGKTSFAEVTPAAAPAVGKARGGASAGPEDAALELRLPGDRSLVVRRGFDRDLLIELVRALEGMPSMLEGLP